MPIETKWSYKVIQDILATPNVIAVKWPARLDRSYRTFFRLDNPPDLYSVGIMQVIDDAAERFADCDNIYITKSDGSEELFRKIRWAL